MRNDPRSLFVYSFKQLQMLAIRDEVNATNSVARKLGV